MIMPTQFDELEVEELYERLLYQQGNAFFCITMETPALHVELAEKMCKRFPAGEVQIIDFSKIGVRYSSVLVQSLIEDDVKYVFLANFQLANGHGVDDAMFFQILNFSRDALAELPVVLVFMMPMYFRVQIAQGAPDFNSFFVYRADFVGGRGDVKRPELSWSANYSEANRQLFEYYIKRYNSMTELDSRQAFDTLTMILALNNTVCMLSSIEQARFYENFRRLLPKYMDEPDIELRNIAEVFLGQADYDIAREWYLKELSAIEKIPSKNYHKIVNAYNGIALTYDCQRDHNSALEWFYKVRSIVEEVYGEEHEYTATFYVNIAAVYRNQGDYDNSLEFNLKALSVSEKLSNKEDSIINAVSCNNIALTYGYKKDYPNTLEWLYKALDNFITVQGEEHPNTATCYSNIAWVYMQQGNYVNSLELYLKSYTTHLRKLGNSHHSTRATRRGLELTYQAAALPEQFEEWLEKSLNP